MKISATLFFVFSSLAGTVGASVVLGFEPHGDAPACSDEENEALQAIAADCLLHLPEDSSPEGSSSVGWMFTTDATSNHRELQWGSVCEFCCNWDLYCELCECKVWCCNRRRLFEDNNQEDPVAAHDDDGTKKKIQDCAAEAAAASDIGCVNTLGITLFHVAGSNDATPEEEEASNTVGLRGPL